MKRIHPLLLYIIIISFFILYACSTVQPGSGGGGTNSTSGGLPAGVTAFKTNNNDQIIINSRYQVNNNEWNVQYAKTPFSETIFYGSTNGTGFFGWQWSWNNNNQYTVLAYPEVFCGDSPWAPLTNHPMDFPFIIAGHQLTSSFNISQTTSQAFGGNTYDLAYDIWIISNNSNPAAFTSTDIKCEVMIWLASANAIPDGISPTGSLSANGYNFNYYYATNQGGSPHYWIYAAFSAGSGTQIFNAAAFDITPFLSYLTNKGVLNPSDYVCTVELGTEVAIGAGITVISNYSVVVSTN